MDKQSFEQYVRSWREELIHAGFKVAPIYAVSFYNRVRNLGTCHLSRDIGMAKLSFNVLLLNLIDDDDNGGFDVARTTVLHELIHAMPGSYNHGPRFQSFAQEVNLRYGSSVCTHLSADDREVWRSASMAAKRYKYFVTCDCGHTKVYRARACRIVSSPERYHCRKCGGHLHTEILQ